jgi:hypothetical protein
MVVMQDDKENRFAPINDESHITAEIINAHSHSAILAKIDCLRNHWSAYLHTSIIRQKHTSDLCKNSEKFTSHSPHQQLFD